MDTSSYLHRLVEVSQKKYQLLEAMLQTYLLQDEALSAGNTENQDELIENRQALMDAIDKLDEQFHVYNERLKSTLGIQSLDALSDMKISGKDELKSIVGRITRMLEVLSDKHRKTEMALALNLRVAADQVQHLNKSKMVSKAYQPGSTMPSPSVYFDKKK